MKIYNNDIKLKLLYTQNENKASYNGASHKGLSPGERDKYCSNILALYDQHFTDSCWSRLDVACFTVRPLRTVVRAAIARRVERLEAVQTPKVSISIIILMLSNVHVAIYIYRYNSVIMMYNIYIIVKFNYDNIDCYNELLIYTLCYKHIFYFILFYIFLYLIFNRNSPSARCWSSLGVLHTHMYK